jgi:hypothetical protein
MAQVNTRHAERKPINFTADSTILFEQLRVPILATK